MITIGLVSLKWNYGKREEGYSYEYNNIEQGLKDCMAAGTLKAKFYHPDEPGEMDLLLKDVVSGELSVILHVEFDNNLDLPEEIALLAIQKGIKVVDWSSDASWRFHNFILPRKHRYTHWITTHSSTLPWYRDNNMKIIRSQWGISSLYGKGDGTKKYDISFVGQRHSIRGDIMRQLNNAGIKVELFGNYWDNFPNWHGYVTDFNEVLKVFQQSKICLNLSNPFHTGTLSQYKGRTGEIPGCGSFQLCTPADDIESYFVPNKEIVIVRSVSEMVNKIHYYLANDSEREKIAAAGYARAMSSHTWDKRFDAILAELM